MKGVFQNVEESIVNTLFLAKPIGGQLTVSNESLETKYFSVEEALRLVTWKNFRQRIEYCLRPDMQPFYIEF
ncbi:hypothetical protein GUA98_27035 [Paenibacillus sp. P13VS]|nr:hypothetical protein [Paenibacillus sp. P13VS]